MGDVGVALVDQLVSVYRDRRWLFVAAFAEEAKALTAALGRCAGIPTPSRAVARPNPPILGLAVHGEDTTPDQGFPVLSMGRPSSGDFTVDLLACGDVLLEMPDRVQAAIDRWDPDHRAEAIVPHILTDRPVAGRPTFGARPPAWAALEDKLAVLDLWVDAGIETSPAMVVAATDGPGLVAAHRRLAGRNGSVWAVDNTEGLHGGAAGTHWVPTENDAVALAAELGERFGAIRVMPFLDGIPCSIHGIVLGDRVVHGRPNEMLIFLDQDHRRFHYGRFATMWDPDRADRSAMETVVVAVGQALRSSVGYRGVFTLDGVLTSGGFLPTEINPRYGVALPTTLPVSDGRELDLMFLNHALIADVVRPDPDRLQAWLTAALDRHRRGTASFLTHRVPGSSTTATIVGDGGALSLVDIDDGGGSRPTSSPGSRPDGSEDTMVARVRWAPAGATGRLDLRFGPAFPVGPSAAAMALSIGRLVDDEMRIGLDRLTPAATA